MEKNKFNNKYQIILDKQMKLQQFKQFKVIQDSLIKEYLVKPKNNNIENFIINNYKL